MRLCSLIHTHLFCNMKINLLLKDRVLDGKTFINGTFHGKFIIDVVSDIKVRKNILTLHNKYVHRYELMCITSFIPSWFLKVFCSCKADTQPFNLQPLFQKSGSRKVVLQTRIFFWSTTFLQPEKRWIYGIKPPFFLVNHFSRTRFLKPDFSNQISRTTILQLSRKVVAE